MGDECKKGITKEAEGKFLRGEKLVLDDINEENEENVMNEVDTESFIHIKCDETQTDNKEIADKKRGILKHERTYSNKHVDFNMDLEYVPFNEKKDFTIEIQIVEKMPKKVISYAALFAEQKVLEEKENKKIQREKRKLKNKHVKHKSKINKIEAKISNEDSSIDPSSSSDEDITDEEVSFEESYDSAKGDEALPFEQKDATIETVVETVKLKEESNDRIGSVNIIEVHGSTESVKDGKVSQEEISVASVQGIKDKVRDELSISSVEGNNEITFKENNKQDNFDKSDEEVVKIDQTNVEALDSFVKNDKEYEQVINKSELVVCELNKENQNDNIVPPIAIKTDNENVFQHQEKTNVEERQAGKQLCGDNDSRNDVSAVKKCNVSNEGTEKQVVSEMTNRNSESAGDLLVHKDIKGILRNKRESYNCQGEICKPEIANESISENENIEINNNQTLGKTKETVNEIQSAVVCPLAKDMSSQNDDEHTLSQEESSKCSKNFNGEVITENCKDIEDESHRRNSSGIQLVKEYENGKINTKSDLVDKNVP